ncbi:N-acetylhexosaminidase [Phellopilus nigrolimitatus]|nr:N-acetylhexosaminidase [Phellopilus nigrolimitatus]
MKTTMRNVLLALAVALPNHVRALWPIPRQLSTGTTALRLANSFSINASFASPPGDLEDAISRTVGFLKTDQLAPLTPDRGVAVASGVGGAPELGALVLSLSGGAQANAIAEEAMKAVGTRDESYVLNVPADGSQATLEANSTLGLFRGLTTFGQLWYTAGGQTFSTEAPISITDSPAFPFRGFMLDTARNYFPVSDIKRTLDAMSWVKINQFHWHVVDSQSFPLQVPGFLELAEKAAYDNSSIYSASDVSDIVSYAAARGIDVLIEIDTPGHTSAISKAFPQHIACPEATPWANFAAEPPAGQLRIASNDTVNFTASLLSSVAKMFPSALMSTGGDEVNTACYAQDEETQAQLNATGTTIMQALSAFTNTTHAAIRELGKTPVVWEEMVLDYNVTLPNDTVVMVWISSDDVAAVAEKGFRLVHAASDYFYLDCGAGEWIGADVDGNSWCDPFKSWQKSYSFDPFANVTADSQALILGGEHALWTEQSGPQNLDPIVWPRAASGAEVFWTGATLPGGAPRNGSSALPRLHDVSFRMRARGVNAISLQPLWCALRPNVCDLTA